MICFGPLFAIGADDMIAVVLVILFIVVPVVGQILAKMAKPQRPQAGAGRPRQPAGGKIEDEIGEFLRRVAGGPAAAGRPRARPPAPRRPAQVVRPALVDVVEEQPIQAEIIDTGHREEVFSDIDTGRIARHASKLGSEVAGEEKQISQRLGQTFGREVSDLAKRPSKKGKRRRAQEPQAAPLPPTAAAGFAALLSSTDNIRQAIVLSEILNRPVDRWQ